MFPQSLTGFRIAAVTFLAAGAALAQSNRGLKFEVASVKPTPPGVEGGRMEGGPLPIGPFNRGGHDPGRITWTYIWLRRLIQVAYDFPSNRISGPDWLDKEKYDIVATVPSGTTSDEFKQMLQNLLAERFRLAVHRETKERSGYALVITRNGLKIKESADTVQPANPSTGATPKQGSNPLMIVDASGYPAPRPGNPVYLPGASFEGTIRVNGRFRASALHHAMAGIAAFLGNALDSPVEDQTGLKGTYDVHLEYVPRPASPADAAAADPGPDLLDAVEQQLGLKLVSKKVPVEFLVVDHADKIPAEN